MKTEEEYNAEVLQLMRDLYPTLKGEEKERAERLFPELEESEDERIRKELISYFKQFANEELRGVNISDWVAWLEKQGEKGANGNENEFPNSEQKPADIEKLLQAEYKKGWDEALHQLPQEVDSQIWQIACRSAKTWEESFAILNATQKAYDKGKKDALKVQPNAWSEDDEDTIEKAICVLEANFEPSEGFSELDIKRYQLVDRLKSLKERYTWKPSEQDILLLERIANGKSNPQDFQASLGGLIGKLKKLRE